MFNNVLQCRLDAEIVQDLCNKILSVFFSRTCEQSILTLEIFMINKSQTVCSIKQWTSVSEALELCIHYSFCNSFTLNGLFKILKTTAGSSVNDVHFLLRFSNPRSQSKSLNYQTFQVRYGTHRFFFFSTQTYFLNFYEYRGVVLLATIVQ